MKKYYEPDLVSRHIPREDPEGEVRMAYLRAGQLLSVQDRFPVCFLPLGTIEWHGRQNPLGCDAIKAERLCVEASKLCGGAVMPPLYFSIDSCFDAGHGIGPGMDAVSGFLLPGSFYRIPTELFQNMVRQACANLLERGFQMVILISGHNAKVVQHAMDEVCYEFTDREGRHPVVFSMEYAVLEEEDPLRFSDHAGGYETSMMLHLCPERVNMKANDGTEIPTLAMGGKIPWQDASAERGQTHFSRQVEALAKRAEEWYSRLKEEASGTP